VTDRDPLSERLAAFDPVRVDRAPEPGSRRYGEILERVVQGTPTTADWSDAGPSLPPLSTRSGRAASTKGWRRPGRRAVFLLGAAAAILAIVAGFVVLEPDRSLSPAAAVIEAGENTGDALTLRSEYIRDDGNGGFSVVRSEHRGGDVRRSFSVIEPDGTERTDVDTDEFIVYIGNKGWTVTDGPDEATIVKPEERNAPYAESSAAIVEAAVTESTVTEIGTEEVRGVEATHYRIRVDDAVIRRLGELQRNQLSAFELENASQVRSLDLWIADGYIRRIRVTQNWEAPDSLGTTVDFYDFGADITITPPT
jgi:hypothetical protein